MIDWLTAHSLAFTPRRFNLSMNVFNNEDFIADQFKSARKQRLLGITNILLFLILKCAIQFGLFGLPPTAVLIFYLIGYLFILVGFPLWTIGNNRLKRLRGIPRADQLLSAELKGLSNKFTLYNYVPSESGIIKHLLVTPTGL